MPLSAVEFPIGRRFIVTLTPVPILYYGAMTRIVNVARAVDASVFAVIMVSRTVQHVTGLPTRKGVVVVIKPVIA